MISASASFNEVHSSAVLKQHTSITCICSRHSYKSPKFHLDMTEIMLLMRLDYERGRES